MADQVRFVKEILGRDGGLLFRIFHINLGLGDLKVTFEDLIAAFLGSLLFVVVWWLVTMFMGKKKPK